MSFGHQPPPPKTTDTGTIIGILALIFVGIPILLCIVGGVAIWGLAGFPQGRGGAGGGGGGWKFQSKSQAWQECLDMHKQHEQEVIAEMKRVIEHYRPNPPNATAMQNVLQLANAKDYKLRDKLAEVQRAHGKPPAEVLRQLQGHTELDAFIESSQREIAAAAQADQEQRMAALRARQQQREQEEAAHRLAEQQAREQRQREFANIVPRQPFVPPPVFNNPPPVFNNPPPVNNPPPAPQPQANEPPPGYPATDIAQLKLKDQVFVQVGDKWHPAFVQLKRGKLIQVRSTETGAIDVVTIDRIRVPNEPTVTADVAKPDINVPPALRAVTALKKSSGNKQEKEDDALFIAKPAGDQPTSSTPAAVSPSGPAPVKPAAPVAEYRTWTDDTGKFTIDAELVNFEFDLVTLRRRDGKILSMRIEKLSTGDQAIIRQKFQ